MAVVTGNSYSNAVEMRTALQGGMMLPMELPRLDPAAEARISRAVAAGASVSDPQEAAAAALFARVVQQRVRGSMWRTALRVSLGSTIGWLVLIALPLTLITGLHPAALIAGVGVGLLLFSLSLLLADRQLRFAVQAEVRNRTMAQRVPVALIAPPGVEASTACAEADHAHNGEEGTAAQDR